MINCLKQNGYKLVFFHTVSDTFQNKHKLFKNSSLKPKMT